MPGKTAYHHGDLKRALIDKAIELIGVRGVEALTLKEVAHALGVTHAAPYRHFKDKQALLEAVAHAGFDKLALRMQRAHARGAGDARRQFLDTGFAVVEFAMAHPAQYRAMFFGYKSASVAELEAAPESTAFRAFLGYIAAWQAAGLLRPAPPMSLALAIWSTTHGLSSLVSSGQLRVAKSKRGVRALADDVHAALLDGVRA